MAATDVIAFAALRRHEGLLSVDALQKLEGRRMTALGRPRRTGPRRSNLYRLCNRERILQFDAEVTHGAVHLRMAKQ